QFRFLLLLFFTVSMVYCFAARAREKVGEDTLSNMPVKEITVFKDGHVFVLHEGSMPTDEKGNVVLDYLPKPVIGTFWAYSVDRKVKLSAVTAGRKVVSIDRTALKVRELIEGNVGAKVRIKDERKDMFYDAAIIGIPQRSTEELRHISTPGEEDKLPQQGEIVLLRVDEGVRAVPLERIREVIFVDEHNPDFTNEEFRNIMTLKLDWDNNKPKKQADIGMVYVQRGIRWIPNYYVEIDGHGNAVLKLQATLINELADVEDVKANLVIGVPTFAFKDTIDPISMQDTVARLSRHFQQDSQTAFAFSNAIMSQSSVWNERERNRRRPSRDEVNFGPEVTGSLKNEDLYVFTIDHITLKKGQRMVFPITEFKLKYRDVFLVDLPFGPPPEVRHRFNSEQQMQLARLMLKPKVKHVIRMTNDSKYPITTAPALIFREGRIIAQGMTTYTAVGAEGDLELTIAVDISVENKDKETGRTPNAVAWLGDRYSRTDMLGSIKLTNRRQDKVYLEVTRSILGQIGDANKDGDTEQSGWHEGGGMVADGIPFWWHWHNWPYWWYHFNSIGRATWKFELEPEKSVELEYKWHYFWRQ
ncbi:MAG: hypothetical protein ACYTBV_18530, partial [Planctomycetota bacterium]